MTDNKRDCAGLRLLLRAPYPPPFGGIASHVVTLIPGLKEYGADEVVVLDFGTKNEILHFEGAKIYRYSLKTSVWRILLPRNWPVLALILRSYKGARLGFRTIIVETIKTILTNEIAMRHGCNVASFYQSDVSLELLPCKTLWGESRGIVLTVFGEIYDSPEFFRSRGELFRHLIETPSAVLSSSKHCARSFRQLGVDRPIEALYYGVDLGRFKDDGTLRTRFRDELGLTGENSLLLFLGRFNKEMGLDQIISLAPSLIRKAPSIKLILAGAKGPLCEPALLLQKQYPDHVTVMNDIPFKIQPALYAASDIVLTPSRDQHACMGMTIKEAMAASRPVIGSDSGGIPEAIVHEETGLIVPLDTEGDMDQERYEEAILSLIADRRRCMTMGRSARLRAEKLFSDDVTIKRMAEVFMSSMPGTAP